METVVAQIVQYATLAALIIGIIRLWTLPGRFDNLEKDVQKNGQSLARIEGRMLGAVVNGFGAAIPPSRGRKTPETP